MVEVGSVMWRDVWRGGGLLVVLTEADRRGWWRWGCADRVAWCEQRRSGRWRCTVRNRRVIAIWSLVSIYGRERERERERAGDGGGVLLGYYVGAVVMGAWG